MAYKRKYPKKEQLSKASAGKSDYGEPSDDDEDVIETEVESHPVGSETSFSEKARMKLSGLIENQLEQGDEISDRDTAPKKKYYNSYAKKKEKERQTELGNLITSVLVIVVTAAPIREGLKPTDDEVGSLSVRVANILWRHNILTGKLSGDALDGIAILAVLASYWQRTKPERERIRVERLSGYQTEEDVFEQTEQLGEAERPSPIDPYLDKLVKESEE